MATQFETYGQYLTRLMDETHLNGRELQQKLEMFAMARFGTPEKFTTGSISQWRNGKAFPGDLKREIIGAYFNEEYPLSSVILTMRRLLAYASSHPGEGLYRRAS